MNSRLIKVIYPTISFKTIYEHFAIYFFGSNKYMQMNCYIMQLITLSRLFILSIKWL